MSDALPSSSDPSDMPVALNARTRLLRYVDKARRSPALVGIQWESTEWLLSSTDPVALKTRPHRRHTCSLMFTTRESSSRGNARKPVSERQPMAPPFSDFAKAFVRHYAENRSVSIDVLRRCVSALQFLERAARVRQGIADPCLLRSSDFAEAEAAMIAELEAATAYRVSVALGEISRVVDKECLSEQRTEYRTGIERPLDGDELTEEGQKLGLAKMASEEVLDVLATVSAKPKDDTELLAVRIVDLLVCGGFRCGEVLTLPMDCWIARPEGSSEIDPTTGVRLGAEGILFAAEKAQDYRTKWLPRQAVELAARAVRDLEQLCRPAREVARWMELNSGRLKPFEDITPDDWLDGKEAAERLGLSPSSHANWPIQRRGGGKGKPVYVRVGDVEALFLNRRPQGPVVEMPSGKSQKLSETLVVVWENQFHGNRTCLRFLPRPLSAGIFSDLLSPPPSHRGRQGVLEAHGLHVTPKAFRHWLNTIAAREGLNDVLLAQWMGRRDMRQNQAYKHGTLVQRVQEAKKLILEGQAFGSISRVAHDIPVVERDAFLDAAIEAAHATPFGLCTHNFAATPCPTANRCLSGCGEYLRVKNDLEQRKQLIALKQNAMVDLARSQNAVTEGFVGADRWVAYNARMIANIDEALSVDDDPSITDGEVRAAFPGKPSLRQGT